MNFLEEQIRRMARLTEEQMEAVRQALSAAAELQARASEDQRRSAHLEDQMETFRRDAIQAAHQAATQISDLDARLEEEQKDATQLQEQMNVFRAEAVDAANQATARIAQLEARLAEEQHRVGELTERIAQLEPVAACVDKFSQALGEIARFTGKAVAA